MCPEKGCDGEREREREREIELRDIAAGSYIMEVGVPKGLSELREYTDACWREEQ